MRPGRPYMGRRAEHMVRRERVEREWEGEKKEKKKRILFWFWVFRRPKIVSFNSFGCWVGWGWVNCLVEARLPKELNP